MTTTAEMLTAIRDAIAADVLLSNWCNAHYEKSHTVFLGFNDESPPTESDYPLVAIMSAKPVRGSDRHRITWEVEIGCILQNDTITSDNNKTTCDGFLDVETFRELMENALFRAKFAALDMAGASMTVSDYPQYASISTIKITLPESSRSGISKRL